MTDTGDSNQVVQRTHAEMTRLVEAVRHIAIRLSTAVELDHLIQEALHTSLELAEAEAGSILLYRPDKDKLVFAHVVGEKAKELTGVELAPDQGLAGVAFQSGKTLVSQDAASEQAHLRELGESIGYITRNMVTVPLQSAQRKPLGVLQVLNKRNSAFDKCDVQLIETLAAQIAVAITTLRLHQEARLATLMRFIGDISHDVKNMITPAVVGVETINLIAQESFRAFDENLQRHNLTLDQTTELQADLTRLRKVLPEVISLVLDSTNAIQERMTEIATAVKGEVSAPQFELIDVGALTRRAGDMLRSQAHAKGVILTIESNSNLPSAMIDGKRIFSAIYNLMHNAIDACEEGDTVSLYCEGLADGEFPTGNSLLIKCVDTGPGIPEKIRAKLFTEEAVSTKPGGTGLGTRIIQNVIAAHQGTIEVNSISGVGTTIICRVPLLR